MQGCLTLLLGPPSCGKTTFLKALAGRLPEDQYKGNIQYNGHCFSEFVAARTVTFVAQDDNHVPNLTARETVKFAYDIQNSPNGVPLNTSCFYVRDLFSNRFCACICVLYVQQFLFNACKAKGRQNPNRTS